MVLPAISGLSTTERVNYDNGPTVSAASVNPKDYLKLLTMKPGDFVFQGSSKADKLGK